MKTRSQKLTVLLLKEVFVQYEDAIRRGSSVEWLPLRQDVGYEGAFAYQPSSPHPPSWAEFIGPAIDGSLEKAFNSSSYGVLFVRVDERVFACTFGYGWSLLDPSCYELGFGLRVALNRIDPTQLRSLDMLAYEDLIITTRRQTSRGSELASFDLDVSRDILRRITGRPKDMDWVRSIGGKDAVTIRAPLRVEGLGQALEELLAAFEDDAYKDQFGWIDHLGRVDDKQTVEELDELLVECLRSDTWNRIYMAPPEPVDWDEIDGFGFSGVGDKSQHDDLLLDDYFEGLGEEKHISLAVRTLKRHRAGVFWSGAAALAKLWPIYNCLVWETDHDGKLYALLAGTWFQIEHSFAEEVRRYVSSIDTTALEFPLAEHGEWERDYNRRAAETRPDMCLLDRKLFTLPGAGTSIEFCDLLSQDKQLIHIKRRTHSATLSHLFSQGAVSAEALLGEEKLRQDIRQHLTDTGNDSFLDVVPGGRPTASEYEIVFAIIERPVAEWPAALPFFSQLNLMQRAKYLRTLGFKVRLVHIEEAEG